MLEEIKKILINEKRKELNQKEKLDQEIEKINQEAKKINFDNIDKKLIAIENEINILSKNHIKKLLSASKITKLHNEFQKIAKEKMEILSEINNKRETLIIELSKLTYNSGNIEKEIKLIEKATTLQELGLTEQKTMKLLRKYHNHYENSTIQKVFSEVNSKKITTKEEIFKTMQELFQTNHSTFVIEMKSTPPCQLASDLIEIGIIIDKDKLEFLNELYKQLSLSNNQFPTTEIIEITDKLDEYYCNEINKVLLNSKILKDQSSLAFLQIMALSILISIAKENKKEKQTNK